MNFGADFESYHKRLLGGDYDEFIEYLRARPTRKSLRVNTLKSNAAEVDDFLNDRGIDYAGVPWCGEGRWVPASAELDTMEHQLGWFFIQEAASMAPVAVLDPQPGEMILDLCAAPGAKTTQIAAATAGAGAVVANDDNYTRIRALVYNIQRCGASNTVAVNRDAVGFEKQWVLFDRVLVDAPCSSVGTARKNPEVLKTWSIDRVQKLSWLQTKLVSSAFKCLKDGGSLVYSTCTTSVEENERVIEDLLSKFDDAELAPIKIAGFAHVDGLTKKTRKCVRVLPQHNDTESYFIARVVKNA